VVKISPSTNICTLSVVSLSIGFGKKILHTENPAQETL